MRFLGLGLQDRVPDAKTIWLFRERLTRAGAVKVLFARFDAAIREAGYIAMSGQLVDASLIATPKQRNTVEEKTEIRAGKTADEIWPDRPAKARQKDTHARWTIQFSKARVRDGGSPSGRSPVPDIAIPSFGYKTHASIDKAFRFIRLWVVTDAAAHDGRRLREGLIDKTNTGSGVWADSAYRSLANEALLRDNGCISHIHHRRRSGKSMPVHIRRGNATRSKHRTPVEHVFAVQRQAMGLCIRTIGIDRATTKIGLANIACNMRRLVQIERTIVT